MQRPGTERHDEEEGDEEEEERSTVGRRWPPVDLQQRVQEERGAKGMLGPPQPSWPSLLFFFFTPPCISPPPAQQKKRVTWEGEEGRESDKNADVLSFDGATPCQCIPALPPPIRKFQFFVTESNL